jgi:uncharacterized protein (TIGR00369 family)
LQDFGECSQSSQIGPHFVHPLSVKPTATTPRISANRLNMILYSPHAPPYRSKSGIFKPRRPCLNVSGNQQIAAKESSFMQSQPQAAEFDIEEARRILGDVIAPWVQDLGLSIGSIESTPPPGAGPDWQPGAILRMAFSERLCRSGGIVCGQALMAFADTSMVIAIMAANRGYRPMTTVDQTTHFMRAATASDVLADARVVRLGRTMSFGRVTLSSAADHKPVAMVTSAFAML